MVSLERERGRLLEWLAEDGYIDEFGNHAPLAVKMISVWDDLVEAVGTCSRCVKRDTSDCPADGHPAADGDTFYCAEFEGGER